ncbi:MAG TPA: NAD-dependent epimerase/dehydratase family protein [Alphaproteobacteria bacterium]|nr:NAD-dependent epimerase/dehydratase family protein [Alphaproteobacteria bacterium]
MARLNLVTGGSGFIGRHLVDALLARGERVRVLDLRPIAPVPENVELALGSITDAAHVARAVAGCDRVFHLAANPNLWAPDPKSFDAVNHQGTRRMLEAAQKAGVARFVYTSTESILKSYRAPKTSQRALIDETVVLGLDDMPGPYCRSKYLAEQAAREAAAGGLPVVIVNPTMPIGPGDGLLTPPSRMILGFLNGETPAYLDCEFNLVDARDVAAGQVLAAEKGRVGERYILGNVNLSLGELLASLQRLSRLTMPKARVPYALALVSALVSEGLANITKKPPMAPLTGVRLARTSMAFDCSKARNELGWQCRTLDASLVDTMRWMSGLGLLRRPVALPLA